MKTEALLNAEAAIDEACQAAQSDTSLIRAKCRGLLAGYDRRWRDSPYEPIEVEKTCTAPLINPDTNKPSRTFQLAGRLDLLARYHGRLVLFDHKTTSQDIEDPAGSYWRQLVVEAQPNHYALLLWLNGCKVDDVVWDCVRKPQISPKKLTKADIKQLLSTCEYYGASVSGDTATYVLYLQLCQRLQILPNRIEDVVELLDIKDFHAGTERETLAMYEARLVRDCTVDRPEHYFQRRSIPRLDSELIEYSRELWEHGLEMLHARNTGHNARNSGACMLYGSPCKFLGICSGYDKPDSDKWVKKEHAHNELPELPGDGCEFVTNSRVRCFQTCRRKHYYEYELLIERMDEEERDALVFGTIWHKGVNAWWSTFLLKESQNGDGNDNSAGDGLAEHSAASQETLPF